MPLIFIKKPFGFNLLAFRLKRIFEQNNINDRKTTQRITHYNE
jgi:hypothetical protein